MKYNLFKLKFYPQLKSSIKAGFYWLQDNWYYQLLFIWLSAFLLFAYFQSSPYFPDPDSFFHVKISQLLAHQGVVKDFYWLPYTTLATDYIDQHLLYHALLAPWVTFLPPILGAKIFTAIIATALITLFFWLLKKSAVPWAFIIALLILFTTPFTFRINLVKAPVVSIIILLLGVYFLFTAPKSQIKSIPNQQKNDSQPTESRLWSLFILSAVYVWLYGGFPLIIVLTGLYSAVNFLFWLWGKHQLNFWQIIKPPLAAIGGVLTGIVINPYFPRNLIFYWQQTIQIGLINYQNKIGVGGEWYPYEFNKLIAGTALLTILAVICLVLFGLTAKKQSAQAITLLIFAALFLGLTLKSQRYVEYYVPFFALALAFIWRDAHRTINWRSFLAWLWPVKKIHLIALSLVAIYCTVCFTYIIIRDQKVVAGNLRNGLPYDKYQEAGNWLRTNLQPGEIVVHSDWDDFPLLFYQNSRERYIAGLDPTFFYRAQPELYWQWVDLTMGKTTANLAEVVNNQLHSRTVIIENDHQEMYNNFLNSPDFTLKLTTPDAYIFQLKNDN